MVGILAHGAYIPCRRLQRASVAAGHRWFAPGLTSLAKGERAFANWDEDTVTMAVEAGRDALGPADRSTIAGLSLASTTLPFADRQNAGIVKEALNLSDDVLSADFTGSLRAGTTALIHALRSAQASNTAQLCVASEHRVSRPCSEGELLNGDAAAAIMVGTGQPIARFIGSHSSTVDFVDHYRAAGNDHEQGWEGRWIRDLGYGAIIDATLAEALDKLAVQVDTVKHLIVPITLKGVAAGVAKRAGIATEAVALDLGENVGHAGTAHPLLMLSHALERAHPGDIVIVIGFGQGCDVLAFEATAQIGQYAPQFGVSHWLERRHGDDNYLRFLSFTGNLDIERGMRAEVDNKQPLTALYRNRKTVLGFVGGRCTQTGTVQFPKSDISIAPNAHTVGTQEDYPLADKPARINTYTADLLTYSPSPPSYYGMVEFEGGGRLVAEFTDVFNPDAVAVGAPMRMMFRIRAVDEARGFIKYFWKAVPADNIATKEQ